MNSGKSGKLFIVLVISLIAFGFGSCANAVNSGNDVTFGLIPSTFALDNEQQISVINDASFEPVHVMRHFYNTTNTTTANTTTNSTTKKQVTNKTTN